MEARAQRGKGVPQQIEDGAGNAVQLLPCLLEHAAPCASVLLSALYNAQGFNVTSASEEYWVYGVVQTMLMEVIKEHLNLAE